MPPVEISAETPVATRAYRRQLRRHLRRWVLGGAVALSNVGFLSAADPESTFGHLFRRPVWKSVSSAQVGEVRTLLDVRTHQTGRTPDVQTIAARFQETPSDGESNSGAPPASSSIGTGTIDPGINPLPPMGSLVDAGPTLFGPLAPTWADPVSEVPNFFGDFTARTLCSSYGTGQVLEYTGVGTEGVVGFTPFIRGSVVDPLVLNGPGGPLDITTDTELAYIPGSVPENVPLFENAQLTALVQALYPGATFDDAVAQFTTSVSVDIGVYFRYLVGSGMINSISLPNPAGGGLVGRIKWIENNTALPKDRVYFQHNTVSDFRYPGSPFTLHRYTFGVERTWFDGIVSTDVRLPFASTAAATQTVGQDLRDDHVEFGNVGLLTKLLLLRTPNLLVTSGLGLSLPTAADSRMMVGATPVVEIQNETVLLQPFFAAAWAPNNRCYSQYALQLDFDPFGNPVRSLPIAGGELTQIGRINDQRNLYLSGNAGYWLFRDSSSFLNGVAAQGELHYNRSIGSRDTVQLGGATVADCIRANDSLNATAGFIFRFPRQTDFSLALSVPVGGQRLYDWNAIAQFSMPLGGN